MNFYFINNVMLDAHLLCSALVQDHLSIVQ